MYQRCINIVCIYNESVTRTPPRVARSPGWAHNGPMRSEFKFRAPPELARRLDAACGKLLPGQKVSRNALIVAALERFLATIEGTPT